MLAVEEESGDYNCDFKVIFILKYILIIFFILKKIFLI